MNDYNDDTMVLIVITL